jgi:hypothetical protein
MPEEAASSTETRISFQEAYKLYEDGKHRRYGLLFSVNGGAFAIAKLIGDKPGLGALRLPYVALGMVLFTITMVFDIYKFGSKWSGIANQINSNGDELYAFFGRVGRIVLIVIGTLICLGWTLASAIFGWAA